MITNNDKQVPYERVGVHLQSSMSIMLSSFGVLNIQTAYQLLAGLFHVRGDEAMKKF